MAPPGVPRRAGPLLAKASGGCYNAHVHPHCRQGPILQGRWFHASGGLSDRDEHHFSLRLDTLALSDLAGSGGLSVPRRPLSWGSSCCCWCSPSAPPAAWHRLCAAWPAQRASSSSSPTSRCWACSWPAGGGRACLPTRSTPPVRPWAAPWATSPTTPPPTTGRGRSGRPGSWCSPSSPAAPGCWWPPWARRPAGRAAGHPAGPGPPPRGGAGGPAGLHPGHLHAQLPAGDALLGAGHPVLPAHRRGAAAAHRLRVGRSHGPAGAGAGRPPAGPGGADHLRGPERRAGPGLHPHRPRQGTAPALDHHPPRPAQQPGAHPDHPGRVPALLAGQPAGRGGLLRLAGGGPGPVDGHRRRRRRPGDRPGGLPGALLPAHQHGPGHPRCPSSPRRPGSRCLRRGRAAGAHQPARLAGRCAGRRPLPAGPPAGPVPSPRRRPGGSGRCQTPAVPPDLPAGTPLAPQPGSRGQVCCWAIPCSWPAA